MISNQINLEELKEGDVFLFYVKEVVYSFGRSEEVWKDRLLIFQGFGGSGGNAFLTFMAPDLSGVEGYSLETLSRMTYAKLAPDQHPTVVKSGLGYTFA